MYDDEFELTFNLQDEDAAPVELPKAAEEAGPEAPAETREPAADEEPTIVLPDRRPEPAAEAAAIFDFVAVGAFVDIDDVARSTARAAI